MKVDPMMIFRRTQLLVLICALLASCGSMRPEDFSGATPRFEPDRFFEGPVRSWGVVESRAGNPKSRLRADLMGRREGSDLVITQDFTYEDGHTEHRTWNVRRIDEHRYEATSPDVVGVAVGVAFGNAYRWQYTLETRRGSRLSRVRMEHWMYLAGDGETMINRVVISKFGIIIGRVTEYFRRGSAPVPAVVRTP